MEHPTLPLTRSGVTKMIRYPGYFDFYLLNIYDKKGFLKGINLSRGIRALEMKNEISRVVFYYRPITTIFYKSFQLQVVVSDLSKENKNYYRYDLIHTYDHLSWKREELEKIFNLYCSTGDFEEFWKEFDVNRFNRLWKCFKYTEPTKDLQERRTGLLIKEKQLLLHL